MKRGKKIFLFLIMLIVLGIAVYFTFFFYYGATDLNEYLTKQNDCMKTRFVYPSLDATWEYTVLGGEGDFCQVSAKVLEIREGKSDRLVLQGKSMVCLLPKDYDRVPEDDLSYCHGILKEELQRLVILDLHKYIVENLGEINSVMANDSI